MLNISRLLLNNNTIVTMDELAFWGLEYHLRTLDLSWNRLSRVPVEALRLLRELHNLHLTGNRISTLKSESFLPLGNLENLYLDKNPLISFEETTFRGTHLHYLMLDSTNLTHGLHSIPTHDLQQLKSLSVANNRIADVTRECLRGLKSLRYLDLDSNLLTRLPGDVFSEVGTTLETLLLNSNRFTRVPRQSLRRLTNLQSLQLNDNEITKIHARSFNASGNLASLDLSYNNINDISSRAFIGLANIVRLDLRHNKLITLDEKTFNWPESSTLKRERRIYLSQNPWLCNCLLKWLRRDYKRQNDKHRNLKRRELKSPVTNVKSIVDIRSMRCQRPDFVSGRPLIRVSLKDLTCDHDYYYYYDY